MSSTFTIDLNWTRTSEFSHEKFDRNHTVTFSGNQNLKTSAAAEYSGDPNAANPEELIASALSSCHMLTFLVIASKSGYVIDSYLDKATATLDKNEEGKVAITIIDLKPIVKFSGDKKPDEAQLKSLHEKAHRNCFIANSIKTKVNIL